MRAGYAPEQKGRAYRCGAGAGGSHDTVRPHRAHRGTGVGSPQAGRGATSKAATSDRAGRSNPGRRGPSVQAQPRPLATDAPRPVHPRPLGQTARAMRCVHSHWQSGLAAAMMLALSSAHVGMAQSPQAAAATPQTTSGSFLLTVVLRHDQSKTLSEINERLKQNGYFQKFPPEGIEVVSWYIVMGIGQVVTLRVPAERLREVNRAVEETAWGGYRTEFYPTYDYKAIAQQQRQS